MENEPTPKKKDPLQLYYRYLNSTGQLFACPLFHVTMFSIREELTKNEACYKSGKVRAKMKANNNNQGQREDTKKKAQQQLQQRTWRPL